MAKAYTLIQAQTLTSSAASVTFSNIPQNYIDLIVKISGRATAGSGTSRAIQLQINGDTTYSNYRQRYIRTDDTGAAQSGAFLSSTGLKYYFYGLPNANVTANSFGAAELTFINYAGSSYKTFSAEAFAEGFHNPFTGTSGNSITAALWVNTAAITTLVFNPDDSSSFAAGSTFYLYGVGGARATGGTIAYDANYTYHTFTSTSAFTPLEKIKNAEILLVAGGGGAGGAHGGGGGAGGVISYRSQTFLAGTSYTAVVGAGGVGSSNSAAGTNGGISSLGSLAAIGGGGGGSWDNATSPAGVNGGSGGGGSNKSLTSNAVYSGGTGVTGQGFAGGNSSGNSSGGGGGGGGGSSPTGPGAGGSSAIGYDGINYGTITQGGGTGGFGGAGTSVYHSWHVVTSTGVISNGTYYIAGGGAGGSYVSPTSGTDRGAVASLGGIGGGGYGGRSTATGNYTPVAGSAGTTNSGSGGGGGAGNGGSGSAGGSGLIIVRYPSI